MSARMSQIFDFMYKPTPIHRLDPRSKGFFLLVFGVLTFLYPNLLILLVLYFMTFFIVLAAKSIKSVFLAVDGVSIIIYLLLFINSYLITLNFALIAILRILILLNIISIYFQTTDPERLMQSMVKLRIPYYLGFSLSLSFRFIPTMARESEIVQNAQKSRGHNLEEGNFLTKIRNYFPIIIPLIMNSIRRAFHVAEALETRGFGAVKRPTFYHPLKFRSRDWIFTTFNLLLLIIGIVLKINPDLLPPFFFWNLSF